MEDERITDQITNNSLLSESQIVDKYSETGQLLELGCKAASHEKPSAKQKPKTVASSQKRKESSDIVIKTEEEEEEEEEVEVEGVRTQHFFTGLSTIRGSLKISFLCSTFCKKM